MSNKKLIFLYNPSTLQYIKSHNKRGISWCNKWTEAEEFSDMFILCRLSLRLYLNRMFKLNLIYKEVLTFDNVRGIV